jgi:hypothetical protein
MSKPILTCLSISCPERFSICCGARSKAVTGDEGTGHFECSKCGKEYIGGKCTAWSKPDDFFDEPQEPETMSNYKSPGKPVSQKTTRKAGRNKVIKEIENVLPADIDLRKEITEWTFSKNRDYAEGQQNMLDRVRMAIESVKEEV